MGRLGFVGWPSFIIVPFSTCSGCDKAVWSGRAVVASERAPGRKVVLGLTLSSDSLLSEVELCLRGVWSSVLDSARDDRAAVEGDTCMAAAAASGPTHGLEARFERESRPED